MAPDDAPDDRLVECLICGQRWRSLGHHLRVHGMSPDEYRDRFDIRRRTPLTSPSSRARWRELIAEQIATGALDEHYARNAERGRAARERSALVKRRLRDQGAVFAPSRKPQPREVMEAIVAAIEAGEARRAVLARAPMHESTLYANLRRHSDLKSRLEKHRMAKSTQVGKTEIARIVAHIEQAYPRASLMYARIAIALIDAPDRTMSVSDLSDALGKGRDATAVQNAVARLVAIGVVTRELVAPAGGLAGGRYHSVQLARSAG